MYRALIALVAALIAALALSGNAFARGGNYTFDGGTQAQRTQIKSALDASAFDWSLVPGRVTMHVGVYGVSHARPGHAYIDAGLLAAGKFAWATVQDEYAHQIDFFLFNDAIRSRLTSALGARDWCYGVEGLAHGDYGCERFSSTLVWSYWPSKSNAYRPASANDESAAMSPAAFRGLMAELIGAPRTAAGARL
jgi:hypothetical protein